MTWTELNALYNIRDPRKDEIVRRRAINSRLAKILLIENNAIYDDMMEWEFSECLTFRVIAKSRSDRGYRWIATEIMGARIFVLVKMGSWHIHICDCCPEFVAKTVNSNGEFEAVEALIYGLRRNSQIMSRDRRYRLMAKERIKNCKEYIEKFLIWKGFYENVVNAPGLIDYLDGNASQYHIPYDGSVSYRDPGQTDGEITIEVENEIEE